MTDLIFKGFCFPHTCSVTINDRALNPRLELWHKSPSGFSWGFLGSGPSQLSRAILYEYAKRVGIVYAKEFAEENAMQFKENFISKIPTDSDWIINGEDISFWLLNQVLPTVINTKPVTFGFPIWR